MKRKCAALLTLIFATSFGCWAEEAKPNEKPLADVKKEIQDGKAVIVDVRELDEWNEGHVKDAKLVSLSGVKSDTADLSALPKDKTIYCYCRAGKRALATAALLSAKGYHATALKEGFSDLSKNGFETSK